MASAPGQGNGSHVMFSLFTRLVAAKNRILRQKMRHLNPNPQFLVSTQTFCKTYCKKYGVHELKFIPLANHVSVNENKIKIVP